MRRVRGRAAAVVDATEATAPTRVTPKRLQIEDLTIRYGGVVAADSITLEVRPGEVVGLIGPNGAGKTSLMDAVSGFARYQGRVLLDGRRIDEWRPHRRASAGLVRSFQSLELFAEMTVFENLQVARDGLGGWRMLLELVRPAEQKLLPITVAAVQEFGLGPVLQRSPDELSYGQRRLAAIARAVAAEPSVLLLDEPVAGLSERESQELAQLVRRLADAWGIGVMVIEHNMDFVMSICDRITVIDFGRFVCSGTPDEVRRDRRAISAYLGDELHENGTGSAPTSSVVPQ
jgi:ABC-type branched-subunit amino acid transport system ATPase component